MKFKKGFNPDELKGKLKIIEISPDVSYLTDNQKKVIEYLIEASKMINDIFYLQKYRENLNLKSKIENLDDKKITTYFSIQQGPFDQFRDNEPYIEGVKKNDRGGFYPDDLSINEWDDFINDNPDLKDKFISNYSIITRKNGILQAVPYSVYYKQYLEKASELLIKASDYADNFSVKSYLTSQANAFLNNDFAEADIRWLQLEDNDIESLISACEFYEDKFLGYKASFTSFVAVRNREEFKKIGLIKKLLDTFQENLPIPAHYKKTKRGSISQIQIVNLVYSSGDARGPIQTAAFNLPNSQKIRQEFGSKKVLIYNVMEAKFNSIMSDIASIVLTETDLSKVTFPAYFNFILMHEISHELGIGFVKDDEGRSYEVSYYLKDRYNVIEEMKADIMGFFLLTYLVKECYITDCNYVEIVTTYFIGLLRSMRFGKENAHGLASLIQWNFFSKNDVIMRIKDDKTISLNYLKVESVVKNLLTLILTLQGEGDYEKTGEFITSHSYTDDDLSCFLEEILDLPVDIYPYYPIAGEERIEL